MDGNLLVEAATRLRPDVIITDIAMPGLNGIEALTRAGASGFVLKALAARELRSTIEQVLNGKIYRPPDLF